MEALMSGKGQGEPGTGKARDSEFADVVRDLKKHGFTQLRKTTHAWLYGFEEFRFSLPHNWSDAGAWPPGRIRGEWEKVKAMVLAAHPLITTRPAVSGDSPSVVDVMTPVFNPDDLLNDGESAGALPGPVKAADLGSSPDSPTTSSDVVVVKPREEEVMTTKTKAQAKMLPCPVPKCEGLWQGRHVWIHRKKGEWKKEYDEQRAERHLASARKGTSKIREPKKERTPEQVSQVERKVAAKATPINGLHDALSAIDKAFRDIQYERDHYLAELEKTNELLSGLKAAFDFHRPKKIFRS
jgi:hypothetical protein